jgi:hypothetical protein
MSILILHDFVCLNAKLEKQRIFRKIVWIQSSYKIEVVIFFLKRRLNPPPSLHKNDAHNLFLLYYSTKPHNIV